MLIKRFFFAALLCATLRVAFLGGGNALAHASASPHAVVSLAPASGCANGGVAVYQDSGYLGHLACFGPGDYDLSTVCMASARGGCITYWVNEISSWSNAYGSHSGYFYSNNPNCSIGALQFGAGDYVQWVGSACNDTFFHLHLNN